MAIHDTEQPLTLVEVAGDIDHAYRRMRMYTTRAANQNSADKHAEDTARANSWRLSMDAAIQLYTHLQNRERQQIAGAGEEEAEQVG